MKYKPLRSDSANYAIFNLAIPVRSWLHRFSAILFMLVSLGLIILGKIHHPNVEMFRARMVDAFVPVVNAVATPIDTAISLGKAINEVLYIRQENIYLRRELEKLQQDALTTQQVAIENARLHELLGFVDVHKKERVTARIIGDASGPFLRTVLINAGSVDGIRKGHVVVSDRGFIGRIVEAGKRNARVLLITDINSRVPVIMERSRERGILAGKNTEYPELLYLPNDSKTGNGELVITSGDGRMVPPGIPVGRLYRDVSGYVSVKPLAEWHRLEYVSVVH